MKVSVKHIFVFFALFFGAYAEYQAQQTIDRLKLVNKKTEKHSIKTTAAAVRTQR